MSLIDISNSNEIYSVSRLNREIRFLLEDNFPLMWVEGEISNFSAPGSGHWYFSLKDASSQVRCAMFRPFNRKLNVFPKDGAHVLLKVRVSLYEGRGDFQLLVEHLEEIGEGRLRQEFEALKKRLLEAGLFQESLKKKLPLFPKKIGVITSPTGAAIQDILNILNRRFPHCTIVIYPTLVQGNTAAPNIVKAIQLANQRNKEDVLILARGGGSLEDLWPFNEESVAYAIHHSVIPIISGVGHEIDFTIADFVADVRAPTPSAAAELATPAIDDILQALYEKQNLLSRLLKQKLQHLQQNMTWLTKHLEQQHPKRKLAEQMQRLDFCEMTLIRLQTQLLKDYQVKWHKLEMQLLAQIPKHRTKEIRHHLQHYSNILMSAMQHSLSNQNQHLAGFAAKLDALSPLAILKRGFAIVSDSHQHVLRNTKDIQQGDKILVQLMDGKLTCKVENIY